MRQGIFIGRDGRPHIFADWHGPNGPIHLGKEFVVDSGATISGIEHSNGVSLTATGLVGVQGIGGPAQQAFLMSGGELRFDVTDGSGQLQEMSYQDPIAVLGVNVLGKDALSQLGLRLTWDFNAQPATATLSL
jgi:hypothetical protein